MKQEAIRFYPITSDPEIVAVAEVSLFPGVYLRGWYIHSRAGEIEVLPPHKVYRDPETGEEKRWSLLRFDDEATRRRWLDKVREEYIKWSGKSP